MEQILSAIKQAEREGKGLGASVQVPLSEIKGLIKSLEDQEREILGFERRHETLKDKVNTLVTALSCYSFEECVPSEEFDRDVFEVFVGDISDCGRIFAIWDADTGSFYEPLAGDSQVQYIDDVVYWRYSLPEPHEALDLEDV